MVLTPLAVGGYNSSTLGTLAFAVMHMNQIHDYAKNLATGNDMASILSKAVVENGFQHVHLAYFRETLPYKQFDPNRNLADANLQTPRDPTCGDGIIACPPGPCTIWEYDYQYRGAQESAQLNKMRENLMSVSEFTSKFGSENFFDHFPEFADSASDWTNASTKLYKMVATPRCGPLWNYQYVDVTPNVDGKAFDASEKDVPDASTFGHSTFNFFPTVADNAHVYPIVHASLAPVPDGNNLNPLWYYEGWPDCFDSTNKLIGGPNCKVESVYTYWMYNAYPRTEDASKQQFVCDGKSAPPFAPAIGSPPSTESLSLDNTKEIEIGTFITSSNFSGNPRVATATATSTDLHGHPETLRVLVGYVRGHEDGFIAGESERDTYSAYDSHGDKYSVEYGFSDTHFQNGLGVNHDITPHERPHAYREDMCDFTQCRWVPVLNTERYDKSIFKSGAIHPKHSWACQSWKSNANIFGENTECSGDHNLGLRDHSGYASWPFASVGLYAIAAGEFRSESRLRPYGERKYCMFCDKTTPKTRWWTDRCASVPLYTDKWYCTSDIPLVVDPFYQMPRSNTLQANGLLYQHYCSTHLKQFDSSDPECFREVVNGSADTITYPSVGFFTADTSGVTHTKNSESGRYAELSVQNDGGVYSFSIRSKHRGSDYSTGDEIKVSGDLLGGVTPTHDLILVVNGQCTGLCELSSANVEVTTNPSTSLLSSGVDDGSKLTNNFVTLGGSNTICCAIPDPAASQADSWQGCVYTPSNDRSKLVLEHIEHLLHSPGVLNETDSCASLYQRSGDHAIEFFIASETTNCNTRTLQSSLHNLSVCDTPTAIAMEARFLRMVNRYDDNGLDPAADSHHTHGHPLPVEWTRAAAYGMINHEPSQGTPTTGVELHVSGEDLTPNPMLRAWYAPGLEPMRCVNDDQTQIIHLDGRFGDTTTSKLFAEYNWSQALVDNPLFNPPSRARRKHKSNSEESASYTSDLAVLSGMRPVARGKVRQEHASNPYRFRPLEAYYQETRSGYPKDEIDRLASFANSNEVVDSFACDCNAMDIKWEYLEVPTTHEPAIPSQMKTDVTSRYVSSRLLISSYSWSNKRVDSSPLIGLYLPSSKSQITIVERDIFGNKHGLNENRGGYDSDVHWTLDAPSSPGCCSSDGVTKKNMPACDLPGQPVDCIVSKLRFDGSRYEKPTLGEMKKSDKYLKNMYVFDTGSCLRWPYGQLPSMAFSESPSYMWPQNYNNEAPHHFGLEAMVGYCEKIGDTDTFTFCAKDKKNSLERKTFCEENQLTTEHIMWSIGLAPRNIESVCSSQHKTCLVIPGGGVFGSVGSVLHHLKHEAVGYTIMVLPFNYSLVEPYMAPGRRLQPVGHNVALGPHVNGALFYSKKLHDDDRRFTGIRANEAVYRMLDKNQHSVDAIERLTLQLADDVLYPRPTSADALWDSSPCTDSHDYLTAALSDAPFHLRCLTVDDVFLPNFEHGIRVEFENITIRSAFPSYKGHSTPMRFARSVSLKEASSTSPCTPFYVTAPNVAIGPVVADMGNCEAVSNFHKSAITLSGSTVSHFSASVHVTNNTGGAAIMFVGDESSLERKEKDVNVTKTSVVATGDSKYAAAYARAYGNDVGVTCGIDPCNVVIMPVSQDTIEFSTQPTVTNLSEFTGSLGDGYLYQFYRPRLFANEWKLIVFSVSAAIAFVDIIVICISLGKTLKSR